MKKWIILIALVALLVCGILIAEKMAQPAGGGNIKLPQQETTTQATYSAEDLALMELTFEEYQAMTGEEQQEFKNSFSALQVFIDWYWDAKEIFDAKQDVQVIGPGQSIDISDFITSTEP